MPQVLRPKSSSARLRRRIVGALLLVMLCVGGVALYAAWRVLWKPNVTTSPFGPAYLYIRTGASFQSVLDSIERQDLLLEPTTFAWLAQQRD
jgi:UPF0755 protein